MCACVRIERKALIVWGYYSDSFEMSFSISMNGANPNEYQLNA